jgi:hypothetical protein
MKAWVLEKQAKIEEKPFCAISKSSDLADSATSTALNSTSQLSAIRCMLLCLVTAIIFILLVHIR